ncbi:L,D-peptidoglycan transpeptidase YkuD (ErfK/YbiS/YcfS/YnhG family) [Mycobacteroides chelonae]|nr:L,D-peptidoglycan transpeptidase YkuD (ErfK/YbiS/YcfS/YnhG family) [Mycobacteroides chelonae]
MSGIRVLPLSLVLLAAACGSTPVKPVAAVLPASPPLWFADSVGSARQVVSVQGTGGTKAVIGRWQRNGDAWEPIEQGLLSDVGSAGFTDTASDDKPATPTGGLPPRLRVRYRTVGRARPGLSAGGRR